MSTTLTFAQELRQKALEMRKRMAVRYAKNNDPFQSKTRTTSCQPQQTDLPVGQRDPKKMSLTMWQILGARASQGDKAAKLAIEEAKIKKSQKSCF